MQIILISILYIFINNKYNTYSIDMTDPSDKVLNRDLINLANQPYKYGFRTNIEGDTIEKGLTEEVVRIISKKKK